MLPKKIGILGAGGYVGGRLMQMARGREGMEVVALIRGFKSLGKFSATPVSHAKVDTRSAEKLAEGLRGFDAVVNATLGDVANIVGETRVMVEACRAAGVPRFIHLSSAVVYGRAEQPNLPEDAPPQTRSWMLYAREKARTEVYLKEEVAKGGLQIVVLRPGLIWGPGSNWARMAGEQLRGGMTLLRRGEGICNLVYVDNLVEEILHAGMSDVAKSGFYNARDAESVTWKAYATTMAAELGLPAHSVRLAEGEALKFSPKRVLEWGLQQRPLYKMMKGLLKRLSPEAKQSLKTKVYALTGGGPQPPADPAAPADGPIGAPKLNREHWTLQTTVHPLPAEAFARDFGAVPMIPFQVAARRTAAWLKFVTAGPDSLYS